MDDAGSDSLQSSHWRARHKHLVRRNAIHLPKSDDEDDDIDETLTNINSRERGDVSVKEAIGGLFSTKTTQQVTPHELVGSRTS